jgi:hypothetical protein
VSLRFTVVGAACVALLSTSPGCGSDSPSAPATPAGAHGAFVDSVSGVCARAVRAHQGHEFPVEGFDPLDPDPDQLPAVADYFATYGQLAQIDDQLHQLRPPAADTTAWTRLLALVDRITANSQAQIGAARSRDAATFVSTVRAGRALTEELDAAGERFGFRSGTACAEVFG